MLPANEENVVVIHSFIVELGRTPVVRRLALLGKPVYGWGELTTGTTYIQTI